MRNKVTATTFEEKEEESVTMTVKPKQEDINPDDVVAWLITQKNAIGKIYKEYVVRGYMNALRNMPKKLELPETVDMNIFACHTVSEFDDIDEKFKGSRNFIEMKQSTSYSKFSAGMSAYRRYLKYLENN